MLPETEPLLHAPASGNGTIVPAGSTSSPSPVLSSDERVRDGDSADSGNVTLCQDDNTSAAEGKCDDVEVGSVVRTPSGKIGTVSGLVSLLGLSFPDIRE